MISINKNLDLLNSEYVFQKNSIGMDYYDYPNNIKFTTFKEFRFRGYYIGGSSSSSMAGSSVSMTVSGLNVHTNEWESIAACVYVYTLVSNAWGVYFYLNGSRQGTNTVKNENGRIMCGTVDLGSVEDYSEYKASISSSKGYVGLSYFDAIAGNVSSFICNQSTLSMLESLNTKLYQGNVENYSTKFIQDNDIIKESMLQNGDLSEEDNNSIKIYKKNVNLIHEFDSDNCSNKLILPTPLLLDVTYIESDGPFYLIYLVPKTIIREDNSESITHLSYMKFKIGSIDDDTADIKLDYINIIDMIDKLSMNVKLSNIIN